MSYTEIFAKEKIDDYYWRETVHIIIEPNPAAETISILPRDAAWSRWIGFAEKKKQSITP